METETVIEGKTKLEVPRQEGLDDPAHALVFYNPKMSYDRDISALLLRQYLPNRAKVLDLLSGTGSRATRYAVEGNDFEVWANDVQPSAVKLIEKNADLNKVNLKISNEEANDFLTGHRREYFDCIDIDPFGSPGKFTFNAFRALKSNNGLLCLTATDIGSLSGTFQNACYRKYGSVVHKTSFAHELGLRLLITYAMREAAKFNIALEPLFSYHRLHYYRVFLKTVDSRKRTDEKIEQQGFVAECEKCLRQHTRGLYSSALSTCKCGNQLKCSGPIYLGGTYDSDFLKNLTYKHTLFEKINSEAHLPFYYDLHELGKFLNKKNKQKSVIVKAIQANGFHASGTLFSGYGIKTDAPYDVLLKCAF